MVGSVGFKEFLEAEAVVKEYTKNEAPPPIILDTTQYTDVGNARWFVQLHGKNIRYVPLWKSWMVWDSKKWVMKSIDQMTPYIEPLTKTMRQYADNINSSDAAEKLRTHANVSESYNKIIATIKLAQNLPGVSCEPDDFDSDKYLINFYNGTLDLRNGNLREFRREDMMTKCSGVEYNPAAKCPLFDNFLNQIFEGKSDIIKYIQSIMGMCMTGDASQEQIFVFWGSTGANGKGTLVELIGKILSDYTVTLPIESLLSHNKTAIPNDVAMLKGARFCTVNEPEFGATLSEGKIKSLTGKDHISARFLNKEFFRFRPTHHTIISSNPKPNLRMSDGGIARRVVLVPFYVTIPIDQRDRYLDVKLFGEASGVLNWMLEGCIRWQREGLIQPQEIKDAVDEYREEMDPLNEFWEVCTERDPQAIVPHNILYAIYKLWCEVNEIRARGSKGFTQLILNKGIRRENGYDSDGIRRRSFIGLRGTLRATEIAVRYLQSPDYEKTWALEQMGTWNTWKRVPVCIEDVTHVRTNTCVPCVPCVLNKDIDNDFKEKNEFLKCSSTVPSVPVHLQAFNELKKEFGDISQINPVDREDMERQVDAFVKVYFEEISDEEREQIVIGFCGWRNKND